MGVKTDAYPPNFGRQITLLSPKFWGAKQGSTPLFEWRPKHGFSPADRKQRGAFSDVEESPPTFGGQNTLPSCKLSGVKTSVYPSVWA